MLVKLLYSACFGVGALVVRWLAVILLWLFWFRCSVMLRVLVWRILCACYVFGWVSCSCAFCFCGCCVLLFGLMVALIIV